MMIGIFEALVKAGRSSDLYSVATWRTVLTVDWTTKTSAPASWAMAAYRSAFCGIEETAATTPASFSWRMRREISSSLIGAR